MPASRRFRPIVGSGQQLASSGPKASSPSAGGPYRAGTSRDWLKTKVSEVGAFVITGFVLREAVAVAELQDGVLVPVGQVKFGLAGKELWQQLERLGAGPRPVPASSRCGPSWSAR